MKEGSRRMSTTKKEGNTPEDWGKNFKVQTRSRRNI